MSHGSQDGRKKCHPQQRSNPRAEAFMLAFQEQLRSINRSLRATGKYAEEEWQRLHLIKRNKLLADYLSALNAYGKFSMKAYAMGRQTLESARALAVEVDRHRRMVDCSIEDWQQLQTPS